MYSKQEQFKNETIERLYGVVVSDYQTKQTSGRNAKPDLFRMVKSAKRNCGQGDANFSALLALVSDYSTCDLEDRSVLRKEEELHKAIVKLNDAYIEAIQKHLSTLQTKSDKLFTNISDAQKKNTETRKTDFQYIVAQETAMNKLNVASSLKIYFDHLMYGALPAEECPDVEEDPSSGYIASELPLFSHEPISQDIPQGKTGPFYDGLRTLAESDPIFIKSMFRDCNNGQVYVRLFDADNDNRPEYITVGKIDSYYQWIIQDEGSCNWPGYILSALQQKDLLPESDPQELFGCILGPGIDAIDISDFCTFREDKIALPVVSAEKKIWTGYNNCVLALYASLLTTNSNMVEDTEEYRAVIDSLQEASACFSFYCMDKDNRDAAVDLLKEHSDNYRKELPIGSTRNRKRTLVCDCIDTLYETYYNKPGENPQKILQEKYPQLFGKATK